MSFLSLDLNLLRVFDVVMSERNLTRAANRLAMTQPAVSNALRRLRDSLGDELLIRTAHGVRPTPHADELWPAVRRALCDLEAAMAPPTFDVSTTQATFRMAMADATAALWLPALVRAIERDAPGVNVRMVQLTTRDPRPMLLRGDIDLSIGFFPGVVAQLAGEADTPIRHELLYSGQYVCVMRQHHTGACRINTRYLLRSKSLAGQLFGEGARSGQRGTRTPRSRTSHFTDGEPVLHRRTCGRQFRFADGTATPPDRRHRDERRTDRERPPV